MPYQLFHDLFPEIAEEETRSLTITPEYDNKLGLPADQYGFLELFCNEPECDCRRVMFQVVTAKQSGIQAVVAWGWESATFYRKWLRENDPAVIREFQGPGLNQCSSQTKLAPAILQLVRLVLLQDEAYVKRIKRHYTMFRDKIGKTTVKKTGKPGK